MAGAAAFLTTNAFARPGGGGIRPRARALPGFSASTPIPLGFSDEVVVPTGYTARAFIPWGTPITGSYPAFVPGGNTAAEQEQQTGMHHDGMHFFPAERGPGGSRHGVLAVNHEFTEENYLQTGTTTAAAEGRHGRSRWSASRRRPTASPSSRSSRSPTDDWSVVRSGLNRRITANTPMSLQRPRRRPSAAPHVG